MCHVSHVTCYASQVKKKIQHFLSLKKIGQYGGPSWCRVCYQWGLPRLVFNRPGVAGAVLQSPPSIISRPEGHQNPISGLKVTAILLKGLI